MKYTCNKCGSIKVRLEERGTQTALLCADCGAWLKWVGKKEIEQVKDYINSSKDGIRHECNSYEQIEKLVKLVIECVDNFEEDVVLAELARMNTEDRINSIDKLIHAFEMM